MGSIRKRGRYYYIRYYDHRGVQVEESTKSTRKADAERMLKLKEGDVAKGIPVTPTLGKIIFQDAADDLIANYKMKGNKSLPDVEGRLRNHLRPFFGPGTRMSAITADRIAAYAVQRQEPVEREDGTTEDGAAPATVNRELAALKRMFNLAVQNKKLLHDQVPHIEMLDESNVRQGFFDRGQFEDVRDALPENLRGIVTFAYWSGWRVPSEILPLEWRQVDRDDQVIRLDPAQAKNKEGRTLPYGLVPELVDVIDAAWEERKRLQRDGTICPQVFHRDGKPIKSMYGAWRTACEEAGCPGMLLHDFRRTAVRNLVRAGVSENVAMSITGHKTRSVFDRYDITSEDDKRAALGRVAGADADDEETTGRVERMPGT